MCHLQTGLKTVLPQSLWEHTVQQVTVLTDAGCDVTAVHMFVCPNCKEGLKTEWMWLLKKWFRARVQLGVECTGEVFASHKWRPGFHAQHWKEGKKGRKENEGEEKEEGEEEEEEGGNGEEEEEGLVFSFFSG